MSAGSRPALGPRFVIVAAMLAAWFLFFHTTFLVPDSGGTYAWARSLLFDGDVDFTNELARLGSIDGDAQVRFHAPTARGVPGNPFGMGAGVLWIPFVLLAQILLWATGAAASPAGYSDLHVLAASTATGVYGLAALLLGFRVARRFAGPRSALASTLACALGTPFLAYSFHLPTYAHVPASFGVALALLTSLRARERPSAWRWALAGAAVGLAGLIRAQHVLLLLLPAALWLPLEPPRGGRAGRTARQGLSLVAGFAAVFSLQALAWWWIYGDLGLPQGGGFLRLLRPRLLSVLLSPWHGLFSWSPVLLLAAAGLLLLFSRDRRLASGLGLVLLAELWLVSSVADWWGGYAFGARRLVGLTPIFLLGLAVFLERFRRPGLRWLPWALPVAAALWNLSLTAALRTGILSPFREPSYGELLSGVARGSLRLPGYLRHELGASWSGIHWIVHRDSAVRPLLDPAPSWLLPLGLLLCWAVGLAVLVLLERRELEEG